MKLEEIICFIIIYSIVNILHYRPRSLIGNKIVNHSDVVGASPIGAAATTSSLSTSHMASIDCTHQLQDKTGNSEVSEFGVSYIKDLTVLSAKLCK